MLLGIVRSNVEDLLIVATLLEQTKENVDIRTELDILMKSSGQSGTNEDSGAKKIPKFGDIKVIKSGIIFFLKAGKYQQEIKSRAAFTCDGDGSYIYLHQEGLGLVKMGTGAPG
jgi:hypothetical protein